MESTRPNHTEGNISASEVNPQDGSSEAPRTGSEDEPTPPKPPRPMNPLEQAEATLKEAFPTIDPAVVKAVLMASGGKVEPAFNALLGIDLE